MGPLTWLKTRRLPKRGLKLHLGCGTVRLDGWVNIDLETPQADVRLDIRDGLPFPDASATRIYHEHVIEHLTVEEGARCLADWHRLLEPGGVLRIATPDLGYLAAKYASDDWKNQAWLTWPDYQFVTTKAEMLNIAFRWWGHRWLYDEEELRRRMHGAGFRDVTRCEMGKSPHPDLGGLETRPDSMLILEAVR